jgi:general secretion pathway protein A
MPVSFGVLLGVFLAVLCLATISLIIYRSVDMRVSTILEAGDLERPKVTQKADSSQSKLDETAQGLAAAAEPVETVANARSPQQAERDQEPAPPVEAPGVLLRAMDSRSSRGKALGGVLDSWPGEWEISASLNDLEDDQVFFRIGVRQNGLQLFRIMADPDLLRTLNLPAVLELRLPGSPAPRYGALVRVYEETFVFSDPERGYVQWDYSQIKPHWSGSAYVPWKDYLGYERVIQSGSSSDAVVGLKSFLRDLGYEDIDMGPVYDEQTMKVIKGVQAKYGIPTDGLVGPLTKIVLYHEHRGLNVPKLVERP